MLKFVVRVLLLLILLVMWLVAWAVVAFIRTLHVLLTRQSTTRDALGDVLRGTGKILREFWDMLRDPFSLWE